MQVQVPLFSLAPKTRCGFAAIVVQLIAQQSWQITLRNAGAGASFGHQASHVLQL